MQQIMQGGPVHFFGVGVTVTTVRPEEAAAGGSNVLLETGDALLLENGDNLLLE